MVMSGCPRYLIVLHPGAEGGAGRAHVARILDHAPEIRVGSRIVELRSVDEACDVLSAAEAEVVPVAAGGDGTVNLIAQAVRQVRPRAALMGVLPLGTGNAFAHGIGIGVLPRAIAALRARVVRPVDVMCTTHAASPLALVSLSLGFEAAFLRDYARWRGYSRLGAGAAALLRSCAAHHDDVELTLDGAVFVPAGRRVYNAGLYNLPCYAAGRIIWPDADGADGEAEAVAALSVRTYWRILRRGLPTARTRVDGDPLVRRWRTARVQTSGPVQVDGEVVSGGAFDVRVEAAGLSVLVAS